MALNLKLNKEHFLDLLKKLIGETVNLQNDPDRGYIPKEELACAHVLDALNPYLIENGGCLYHEHLAYDEKQERANLIIGYVPPTWKPENGTVSFIGSHFDVVPANPDDWNVPPFELTIDTDGDSLYGRGTTDCLGHVALITDLFIQLAEKKPDLKRAVWAVFICSEEYTTPGIGIDRLLSEGKLERCQYGPCYWIDSSERQPCIGCASAVSFVLATTGKTGHSGFPNQAINSIEFGDEACKYLQDKFYVDFPAHPQEKVYGFQSSSSMKPTQLVQTENSINQIPGYAEMSGDIRLTPFYDINDCKRKLREYAEEINQDPALLPSRGQSGFVIIGDTGAITKGDLELKFVGETLKGIACNLDSDGYKNLKAAVTEVVGKSVPYSITGSLPVVGDLQDKGFDIQIIGFGFDAVYHGDNEYCSLSWMEDGMKIMSRILEMNNEQ